MITEVRSVVMESGLKRDVGELIRGTEITTYGKRSGRRSYVRVKLQRKRV